VTATTNVRVVTSQRVVRAGEAGIAFPIFANPLGMHGGRSQSHTFCQGEAVLESEAFHITNPPVDYSPVEVPTASRSDVVRTPVSPAHQRRYTPVRLGLQQRAQSNFRRYFLRAFWRLTVLVIADLASFYVMRELVRAVRDHAAAGSWVSTQLSSWLPGGILNGWQYAAALFVGLVILGTYGPGDARRDVKRLFLACALATALPLWMTIWSRGVQIVAVQYGLTTVLVWLGLMVERRLLNSVIQLVRPRQDATLRTVFVGQAEQCRESADSPAFGVDSEYRTIGFVDTHIPPAPSALGHITDFASVIHEAHAEAVVVCGYLTDTQFHDVVDAALTAGCKVLSVPRSIAIAGVEPTLVWHSKQPLVELTTPMLHGGQLIVKRAVDLLGAGVMLLITAPLMVLIAVALKLDTRGPVLFGQERIGTGGRRFRVWKFRTMVQGASDAPHRALVLSMMAGDEATTAATDRNGEKVYKLVADERVTPVGRFLRRTSLDELPQMFNVIMGQMSLVGPRPPLPYEFEAYDLWQVDRLRVLPGITGLWQVSGRNLLSYRQMCELDVEYVRRWSLLLDLEILLKTIPAVLFNSGRAA
jgi:exopolysaccharide biosynthesis polyprenyl glycosylphosphotransferase